MQLLKILLSLFFSFLVIACNQVAPDYSGQWEQVDDSTTIKRILTITREGEHYVVLDEIKDTSTGEVSYDEKSTGRIDGSELLTGTNTLTNILHIDTASQQLVMKTHDETTLKFIKIN